MGKALTIRKSAEDEAWLREQQRTTARSQGQILKDLLRSAREQESSDSLLIRFCGDLAVKDREASSKRGFSP